MMAKFYFTCEKYICSKIEAFRLKVGLVSQYVCMNEYLVTEGPP